MFGFARRIVKWTVVSGLVVFGLVSVVGATRIKTAWWSVRDHLRSNVDELVDTRVALQHEIRKLQKEYPERIADLRVQVREIEKNVQECERDRRVCEEVVLLCESDAEVLQAKLTTADSETETVGLVPANVEFRAERLDRRDALHRAAQITETAVAYRSRMDDLDSEHQLLKEERVRIHAELAELESEYRQFKAEIGSMNREIDALKRKEDLVELARRRQGDQEDLFSDRATALQTVRDRIERKKIELEEALHGYRSFRSGNEYEARARLRLANGAD